MTATIIERAARRASSTTDSDLVEAILSFDLSGGDLADFEPRLRRENGWPASFARRAIGEYRRFLVLAATARHPVSPSHVVDQVWHLHLLYTRSYWDNLCGRILPRPLHHMPSTGGAGEHEKFADWYAKTLASYRRAFAEDAPSDIWPAPGAKSPRHRYVDLDTHAVIPRLTHGRATAIAFLLAMLVVLLLGGCGNSGGGGAGPRASDLAGGTYNPLDLPGPQFLVLFVAAFIVACTIAWQIRARARAVADGDEAFVPRGTPIDLDPYAIAYLNGGPVLAANTAIARLVDRGFLAVHASDGSLSRLTAPTVASIDGHPLERAVFAAVGARRTPIRDVRSRLENCLASIRRQLDDSGYLLDPAHAAAARWASTGVALLVPAVGVIKLLIGLERGRPIGILAVLTLAFAAVAVVVFARGLHRSARGDRVLEHLKETHARDALRPATTAMTTGSTMTDATGADATLALGVALFGMTWLSGSEHAGLRKALTPRHGSADGWDTSFGSFGGTSCGGGASCGGGGSSCGASSCGGGGGGCGGCGGGGCGGS